MPIDSLHPDYQYYLNDWSLLYDLYKGERRIKDQGEKYLPSLTGQDSVQYDAYKNRGELFNAFARTVQGLTGSIFRKDPVMNVPEQMEVMIESITESGQTIYDLSAQVAHLIVRYGRCGLFVDKMDDKSNPFISVCEPSTIINWRSHYVNGREQLDLVVLKEMIALPDPEDIFVDEMVEQIRVLELINGACYATLYMKRDKEDKMIQVDESKAMVIHGRGIKYIPFIFIGSEKNTSDINKPPLLDLANINISHWRKSVDMAHGLHYAALPTPWAAGFPLDREYSIGPTKVWLSNDPAATAGYLEFSGKGLEAVENALDRDERMMAVLGARIIERTRDKVETAETARLRQAGEESNLTFMVNNISQGLTESLKLFARWLALPEDGILLELNTDFVAVSIQPDEIKALLLSYQQGTISLDTFLYQMQRGEILPPGRNIEGEMELISSDSAKKDGPSSIVVDESTKENKRADAQKTAADASGKVVKDAIQS